MAEWTIEEGPHEYQPSGGEDAVIGWAWNLEREGEKRRVKVELSGTAAAVTEVDREAQEAIQTKGKSALRFWLEQDELPERIVIHTHGVSRPRL